MRATGEKRVAREGADRLGSVDWRAAWPDDLVVNIQAVARMSRPNLLMTLFAGAKPSDLIAFGDIALNGDASLYEALAGLIEPVVANFPVVTP